MATVYLFIHSLIVAGAFYFALKAFLQKSQLMAILMIDEHGHKITKSFVVAIVLSSLSFLVGIYFMLLCFNLPIPLQDFAKGLKFTLMNVGYSIGIVSLAFAIYPKVYGK